MTTENQINNNLRSILKEDARITSKPNHSRRWIYSSGILAGIVLCLYPLVKPEANESINASLIIAGILLVIIFILRLLFEKDILFEKTSGMPLTLSKKFYPLTYEPTLMNLIEECQVLDIQPLKEDPNGGIVLEYACSKDKQIIYLIACRWDNMIYMPITNLLRHEGITAKHICHYLGIS